VSKGESKVRAIIDVLVSEATCFGSSAIPSSGETLLALQTGVAPNKIAEKAADICDFIGCHTYLQR
jgi:hypothetical protein